MSRFFKFFDPSQSADQIEEAVDPIQLATVVLMIEMARADFHQDDLEDQKIIDLLEHHFDLSHEDAVALFTRGQKKADDSVSLHEFTSTLHTNLSQADKEEVIGLLWQLAMVDEKLDRYEDYLVRKVADLLYVSNTVVLRIRHQVTAK